MIYAAFAFWLLLIISAGAGIYRLWGQILNPRWANWLLLPGTLISEMLYILGCLITGGEIRRAKLMDSPKGKSAKGGEPAPTEATQRLKYVGPVVAALVAIAGSMAAVLGVHKLLGRAVLQSFSSALSGALPRALPRSWDSLWAMIGGQVDLLRGVCEAMASLQWSDWRVVVFVYLAMCLSIRLAPANRPAGPTLVAVLMIAGLVALVGLVSSGFGELISDLWPLVTYIWGTLLLLLSLAALASGGVALVQSIRGKGKAA